MLVSLNKTITAAALGRVLLRFGNLLGFPAKAKAKRKGLGDSAQA